MIKPERQGPLQEHIDALGEDFGKVFHAVWSEWCSGLVRYEEMQELFGSQEKRDPLNAVAPPFFADVQRLFWHDLMLHVTRLTDKSGKALRVESLERFLKGDPDLLKEVKKHREDAAMAAVPVADWRNRAIAHRDRSLATGQSPKPLAAVKLKTCKEVLDHVRGALTAIQRRRMNSSIANMVVYDSRSGALVAHLRGLVDAVQFIASIIDPDDREDLDLEKGRAFLRKLDRSEPGDSNRLFELMDMARHCRKRSAAIPHSA